MILSDSRTDFQSSPASWCNLWDKVLVFAIWGFKIPPETVKKIGDFLQECVFLYGFLGKCGLLSGFCFIPILNILYFSDLLNML